MSHSPKFSPIRLGFTAFASLTVLAACSMDRRPDSTANGRIQKAKCNSKLRFSVEDVNNGRRNALAGNPFAKVRTVFESDKNMVHTALGKQAFDEDTVLENTTDSPYQVNVVDVSCDSLSATLISPTVPNGRVQAEIKDVDVNKIELVYPVDGVPTTVKIELELPEKIAPGTKTKTVQTLVANGVNKLKITQVGADAAEVKVISEAKAAASEGDKYKIEKALANEVSAKLGAASTLNINPAATKAQKPSEDAAFSVADLKQAFPDINSKGKIAGKKASVQPANEFDPEFQNQPANLNEDVQDKEDIEASEPADVPATSEKSLRSAIAQQQDANLAAIEAAEDVDSKETEETEVEAKPSAKLTPEQNRIVVEDPVVKEVVAEETVAAAEAKKAEKQTDTGTVATAVAKPKQAAPQPSIATEKTEIVLPEVDVQSIVDANSKAIQAAIAESQDEEASEEQKSVSPVGDAASAPAAAESPAGKTASAPAEAKPKK